MHLHSQIEQYLTDKIKNGILQPGDQIETETELMERFDASRPTVRQALNKLTNAGYLTRIKGKGSFVTEPKMLHESTSFIASYRKEVEQQNRTLLTQVLSLEAVPASREMCTLFNGKGKFLLGQLTRLRRIEGYHNQRPVVYTTVSVPLNRFPQMLNYDFSTLSLYETLEYHNLKVSHVQRQLEVLLPPRHVAETLEISSFEPVIFVTSTGYLENETPIEYAESYYPASISKFLVDISR